MPSDVIAKLVPDIVEMVIPASLATASALTLSAGITADRVKITAMKLNKSFRFMLKSPSVKYVLYEDSNHWLIIVHEIMLYSLEIMPFSLIEIAVRV